MERGGELPAGPRPPTGSLAHASGSVWILLLMNLEDSSPAHFRVPCQGVREPEVPTLGC